MVRRLRALISGLVIAATVCLPATAQVGGNSPYSTQIPVPQSQGGTGASTAIGARNNLNAPEITGDLRAPLQTDDGADAVPVRLDRGGRR